MSDISYLLSRSSHVWLHLMQAALGRVSQLSLNNLNVASCQKGKIHLGPTLCYCHNLCAGNSNCKQAGPKNWYSWNLSQKKLTKQLVHSWSVPSSGLLDSHLRTSCSSTGGSKEAPVRKGSQDHPFQQQPTPRLTCCDHQAPRTYPRLLQHEHPLVLR